MWERRFFIAALASSVAWPAAASQGLPSLSKRSRWRSFGSADWVFDDPFERSRPGAVRLSYSEWSLKTRGTRAEKVLDLIGFAEAGRLQYDAIHHSARRKPHARPTQLSLGEIKRWIRATPGQHHAIGRYQFIPSTLIGLTRQAGLSDKAVFNTVLQDRLGFMLLEDAGYSKLMQGQMRLGNFMDKLAWIWAGLPLRNGRSAYRGIAGNRATISRRFYEDQMIRIFS